MGLHCLLQPLLILVSVEMGVLIAAKTLDEDGFSAPWALFFPLDGLLIAGNEVEYEMVASVNVLMDMLPVSLTCKLQSPNNISAAGDLKGLELFALLSPSGCGVPESGYGGIEFGCRSQKAACPSTILVCTVNGHCRPFATASHLHSHIHRNHLQGSLAVIADECVAVLS